MNSDPDRSEDRVRSNRWLLLAAVIGLGVGVAVVILLRASSPKKLGPEFASIILFAFAFNVVSFGARWLLTKSYRRIHLSGRLPLVVGLAKVSGLIACVTLMAALLAGLVAGPPFGKITLGALIIGLVAFALVSLVANGLMNLLIVARHFRGTLAATSRELAR